MQWLKQDPFAFLFYIFMYFLLSPLVAMPYYSSLLFFPISQTYEAYKTEPVLGLKQEEVFFPTANGNKLHGLYYKLPGASKTCVVNHGNGSNITYRLDLARLILKSGASVFLYDYQGYGLSQGQPSIDGICADGLAAYDFVANEKHVAPNDLICFGESLGTGVACYVAENRKCAAIILQSPFSSLLSIARSRLFWLWLYPRFMFPKLLLDNLSYLKGSHPPVLLVHGMNDDIVPVENSKELDKLASESKTLVLLPNAGHNDIYTVDADLYVDAMKKFIARL